MVAIALLTLSWSLAVPSVLADEQKDELIRIIRQNDSPLQAMTAERLITLKMSPEWWQYLLNRETKAYQLISNMANGLLGFANNMKWGDVAKLDESGDGKSPLVEQALSDLQGKVQCTIELTDSVKEDYREKVIENFAMFQSPLTNDYYCKPRGGKMNLVITLDAKAKDLQVQVSKDGTQYHFTVPAYVNVMTSPIQEAFKQGM